MSVQFVMSRQGKGGAALKTLASHLSNTQFGGQADTLSSIMGGEGLTVEMQNADARLTTSQKTVLGASVQAMSEGKFSERANALAAMVKMTAGNEAFSHSMEPAQSARQKAATISLNATSNRQWAGAEAMFPTVHIPYDQENMALPLDVAGVGAYNSSGNVNEAWEDLRPIASTLADSKFNSGDDLKLVPVMPTTAGDPNLAAFIPAADWPVEDVGYDANDLLGRQAHKTTYLAVKKANNLLSLCRTPGQVAFEQNDEIDTGSLRLSSILIKVKTKDGEGFVSLDTSTMSDVHARPETGTNSDEKAEIKFSVVDLSVANLKDKDGKNTELFKSLTDAGLKVCLQFDLNATYSNSTRTLSPSVSPVSIAWVYKDGEKLVPGSSSIPKDINDLITAQALEASVHGFKTKQDHKNTNQSRYGITVVFASAVRNYGVRRRSPISVKYPTQDMDLNSDILNLLVKQMDVMVTREMTHDAFRAAIAHFAYLMDNRGAKIVNINDVSSSTLPGQHFLRTTAVKTSIDLVKEVSTLDSKDILENIRAALVMKIHDIVTNLRNKSNVAALKELDGREESYTIVAHATMAPFLMDSGDIRTFGENVKFNVIETNVDSEVGRMWVFPTSNTKDNEIDVFGGMGICVAKELVVIEGTVNQANRQYRMLITQPMYQHHALGCVAAQLEITDIDKLLGDEGLIASVNRHLVNVKGSVTTTAGVAGTGKEVEIDIP